MPDLTLVEAINDALQLAMEEDSRVVVLGQDVARTGGVFRATQNLLDRYGSDRVFDAPLAEGVIIGASIGLAIGGLIPVPEIQFLGFAHNAFNQIVDQLARVRFRSNGRFNAQVTVRMPFGGGVRTPELHSDAFEAHYAHVPGLKVVCPATPHDAKGLLLAAIRDPDPVIFLEPLRGYRLLRGPVEATAFVEPIGKARIMRPGRDCTVIAWSAACHVALRAAEDLAEEGIEVEVIDLRSLVPLDTETIIESVTRTGRAVVVQEATFTGGFAAEIIATIQEGAFYSLQAPIGRVCALDSPYPAPMVEEAFLPDANRVIQAVTAAVNG